MDLSFANSITAKVVKAAAEFNLINNGDKIAVGLSGGKDSTFLLYILKLFQLYLQKDFKLEAVHVDPGLKKSNNKQVKEICSKLNIKLKIIKTKIGEFIEAESNNPCSKCSHFKKGAMISYLKANNFNKLAFGHHLDDAVETYLMSIFYSGQLKTLQPARYLSQNEITIIRPLIYLREKTISLELSKKDVEIVKSCCPYDGNTIRAEVRANFAKHFNDDLLFSNLVSAMRNKDNKELWPKKLEKKNLTKKMNNYWN